MEMVYAALLLHAAKKPVNEENITKVLEAAGATVEQAKIKALVASLEGINIDEAIAKATVVPAAPTPEKKEEKKEEKKHEEETKKAEEAAAGLSALFG